MSGVISQPTRSDPVAQARRGAHQYRSADEWPALVVPDDALAVWSQAGLWVPGSYASMWDLIDISLPDDTRHEWTDREMVRWLGIGAGKVNEYLANRGWNVPLTYWSETVVWANCELAFVGLMRKRGGWPTHMWEAFNQRAEDVKEWLKAARDREITPDVREAAANQPQQTMRFVGPSARGWDQPAGYLSGGRIRKY